MRNHALLCLLLVACGGDEKTGSGALTLTPQTLDFGSVTVGSSGTRTLTLAGKGAVEVSASGAGFAVSDDCPDVLDGSCTITVMFAPTAVGIASGVVKAESADAVARAAVTGEGTGVGLAIVGDVEMLGEVLVGETSAAHATFVVKNDASEATGPVAVASTGPDGNDFEIHNNGCASLAAGATCSFEVVFAPESRGAKAGAFEVRATPGGTVTGTLSATAVAPAHLVAPESKSFGTVLVNTPSTVVFDLSNDGDATITGLALAVGAPFSASSCPSELLANQSCSVTVTYAPTAVGAHADSLAVTYDQGSAEVALDGNAVDSQLIVTPGSYTFDDTLVGATRTMTFTTKNLSDHASGLVTVNLDAGPFSLEHNDCIAAILAVGDECTFDVVFTPTARGSASTTIVVASAEAGEASLALDGIGLAPATLSFSPNTRNYGSWPLESASPSETFGLRNDGDLASEAIEVTVGSGFEITAEDCTTLAPGDQCDVAVRFVPDALGAIDAELRAGDARADLSGVGVAPGQLGVSPSPFTFAPTAVADQRTKAFTVTNPGPGGSGPLTITASGDFTTTDDCPDSLASATSCTVTVTFTPSATGTRSGTLSVSAALGGEATVGLDGNGLPRLELPNFPFIGFSTVYLGAFRNLSIALKNNTQSAQGITTGTTGAGFSIYTVACDGIIAAGGTCDVIVTFTAATVGEFAGTFDVSMGSFPTDSGSMPLTADGKDGLVLMADPSADFGSVPINTKSAARTIHADIQPLAPSEGPIDVVVSGAGFVKGLDGCSGQTLFYGVPCTVSVTFEPTVVGPVDGSITIEGRVLALTANAVPPTGAAPTAINLGPSVVDEERPAGTTVGTLSVSDADVGQSYAYSIVPGSDGADFTLTGTTLKTAKVFDAAQSTTKVVRIRVLDSGGQTFEQNVTVTVQAVDTAPTAVADTFVTLRDAVAQSIPVLANDTDPDGGSKTIVSVTQPAHGTVVSSGTGLTYKPNADYYNSPPGTTLDTFTYTLDGGSTATVSVAVHLDLAVQDIDVACNGTGNGLVVWSAADDDALGIYGRRVTTSGAFVGAAFAIASATTGAQLSPSVAQDGNGRSWVVWSGPDSDDSGVWLKRFAADGSVLVADTLVNTQQADAQYARDIAMNVDGDFVVAYADESSGMERFWLQRFDAAGTPNGARIDVGTSGALGQRVAFVGGDILVSFREQPSASTNSIYARRYTYATGTAVAAKVLLSTHMRAISSAAALFSTGEGIVVWDQGPAGNPDVLAQRVSTLGAAVGSAAQVPAATSGRQEYPNVAVFPDDRYTIVWQADSGTSSSIIYQRFAADGSKLGTESQADASATHSLMLPSVAACADGKTLIVWGDVPPSTTPITLADPTPGILALAPDGTPIP